jgi:transcriptional regulator of acetoin/glycerol metabolism
MPTLSSDRNPALARGSFPSGYLFVALSCSSPLRGASRHRLEAVGEVRLGRASSFVARRSTDQGRAVLTLGIPDERVSSSHARILAEADGAWRLEDLGSKNGSYLNGVTVRLSSLADGDLIQVGQTLIVFRRALTTPVGTSDDVEIGPPASAFATLLPSLVQDFESLAAVAKTEIPVLLVSETGTGKEVVARAVHALSRRAGAFVPVNCGALTATLAESILFGHRRGAFSGATTDHAGLLRSAEGGTVLFDELGDMSLGLQPTLLRVLQEREVLPVGAVTPVPLRVRFVAATHRNLDALVSAGSFREDLFARLAGYVFRLPPLRERREDIGLLTSVVLHKIAEATGRQPRLSAEAGALLFDYDWPRNVRELEKCLEQAVLFAGEGQIEPRHLPADVRSGSRERGRPRRKAIPMEDAKRARLLALLTEHRGNLQAVADALETSRSQVHRWLHRFEIDVEPFRSH